MNVPTTSARSAAAGDNTPWYRSKWKRGGGTKAKSRAMNDCGFQVKFPFRL